MNCVARLDPKASLGRKGNRVRVVSRARLDLLVPLARTEAMDRPERRAHLAVTAWTGPRALSDQPVHPACPASPACLACRARPVPLAVTPRCRCARPFTVTLATG
jgi:hypothetical protein